jgi:hypothetical protein
MSAPTASGLVAAQPPPDPSTYNSYNPWPGSGTNSLTVPPLTIVEVMAVAFVAIAFMHLITRCALLASAPCPCHIASSCTHAAVLPTPMPHVAAVWIMRSAGVMPFPLS